ncbi:UNVERIFIED_CONTAM: Protease Do-like 1, chloroplastic [Sesamum radiatum]|uniref:Protease Do-like 1, chloroplastic n=1 Tax=Sesamum radiatum TaxID=300843 RepID=A0AAW2RB03_SESRA
MGNWWSFGEPPPPPPMVLVPPLFDFPPLAARTRMLESSYGLLFGKLALRCLFEDYFEEAKHFSTRIMLKPIDDPHVDLIATVAGPINHNPEEKIVGNAQFRWQSVDDDKSSNNIHDSTFQIAASWQANKNFLLKGKVGPLSSSIALAFKSWWKPAFTLSMSATRDRATAETAYGFGIRVDNIREASYQRADPNFVMLTPNKEHLAEGIHWKSGKRPVLQSDVNSGNFDGVPKELRPLNKILYYTPKKLQPDELATVRLFQENTPSVVYVTNIASRQDAFTLDLLEVPQGSGSGFVWDTQGHIVTNYHVIRGASDVKVTLADESTYDAKVVGFDADKDVAVLKIDAPKDKLRPIPIGVSADLLVGQKVYAIGNPFGLDHTLTTGVISGLRREISGATGRPIQDVIQTDAAINPGNSGGPLLDSSGNLIGINTAIYSPSGASSGVGFSIPVDTVSGIVDQLVKFGKVTRPILGIKFAPDQVVEKLGVSGVLVLDAPPNGPAGKAGLQPSKRDTFGRLILGDIIKSINGKKVSNGSDLYRILDQCKVGDKVIVEVLRGDHLEKVPVTLNQSLMRPDVPTLDCLVCICNPFIVKEKREISSRLSKSSSCVGGSFSTENK